MGREEIYSSIRFRGEEGDYGNNEETNERKVQQDILELMRLLVGLVTIVALVAVALMPVDIALA